MLLGAQGAWADNVARIGSTEYETLAEAIGALTEDGQTIELLADAVWTSRLSTSYSVTIKPATGRDVTITSNQTNQTAQVNMASGKTLTFDGSDGSLTFDANGNVRSVFEGDNSKTYTFVLKNMTLKNKGNANSNDEGFIHMKKGNLTLENVTFEGTGNAYNVLLGANAAATLTLKGSITCSSGEKANILVKRSDATVNATDLTSVGAPITVDYSFELATGTDYIIGGSADDFTCLSTGWAFSEVDGNLQVVKTTYAAYVNSTGYETISEAYEAATAGDVLYLNEDWLLTARLAIAKNITIKPMEGKDITIKRSGIAGSNCMLILNGASGGSLVLDGDGGSLTIDDNNATGSSTASVEIDAYGDVYMQNLTVKNSKMKCAVYFKNRGKCWLKNVAFEDCATSDYGALYFVRETITLGGNISFTNCTTDIYMNTKKGFIAEKVDDALTLAFPTAPVTVALDGTTVTTGSTLISNTSGYTDDIRLTNAGWLTAKGNAKVLVNYVSNSYDLTVTEADMSTLVLPFNADLPTGVSAYTLTADASTITATEVTSITKDQPVLIVAEAGTYTFTGDATADYSTEAPTEGALVGTYNTIDAAEGNYVLQKHGGYDAAFYLLTTGSNKVIKPFRAYLTAPASAREMKIVFAGGETTGVQYVATESQQARQAVYDLQGRRVMQPAKDLYIVNGKKVLYQ